VFGQYDRGFASDVASFFLQNAQWPTIADFVMNGMDYLDIQEKARELINLSRT